jgi:quercetin dioxygenase-like cupin family protein
MLQQDAKHRVNPAEETIQVGATGIRFLVTGADSNGSAALFEVTIPAGAKLPAPPHSHDAYEETIYGLEGVSTFTVDGEPIEIGPGQALCIRRGAVHGFVNHGDLDARVLAIVSPGVLGPAYFREVAAVIYAAGGGPPDRAKMVEILRRHGLTPAPPPPTSA